MPSFLKNTSRRPCLDFVLACAASSPLEISYSNTSEKVAVVALRNLQGCEAQSPEALLAELVALAGRVEDGAVLFECRGVVRGLPLGADAFSEVLAGIWEGTAGTSMKEATARRASRRLSKAPMQEQQSTPATSCPALKSGDRWKMTEFALEMFLTKAEGGMSKSHFLMKQIFDLLHRCQDGGDEQGGAYLVDLLLSCAHAVLDLSGDDPQGLEEAGAAVNPELVVKCLNSCGDPGTRGTALLVLAKACAAGDAEYVIQNSVPIFTFMGSHFLKVDSRRSFEVACAAIDIIIPHIQKVRFEAVIFVWFASPLLYTARSPFVLASCCRFANAREIWNFARLTSASSRRLRMLRSTCLPTGLFKIEWLLFLTVFVTFYVSIFHNSCVHLLKVD